MDLNRDVKLEKNVENAIIAVTCLSDLANGFKRLYGDIVYHMSEDCKGFSLKKLPK